MNCCSTTAVLRGLTRTTKREGEREDTHRDRSESEREGHGTTVWENTSMGTRKPIMCTCYWVAPNYQTLVVCQVPVCFNTNTINIM